MKEEQTKRLEQMQLDCSKCPLSEEDCQWLAVNFGAPYRLSKKEINKMAVSGQQDGS